MKHALGLLLVLIVTAGAYRSVRMAPFLYEDANFVSQNPAVAGTVPIQLGRARWIANVVNRVQWLIDPTPVSFHVVNVVLHLVNGILVWAVVWGLTRSAPVALIAASLFLVHPINTEAVAYVAGRTELLATLFALGAWLVAWEARHWWQHAIVWLLVGLAVSSKESSVVIVPLIAIVTVFRGGRLSLWRVACLGVPVVAMTVSVLVYDHTTQSTLGPVNYAATQATAVWRYLALVVVPWGQTMDHDFEVVAWPVRYVALVGLVGLAALPLFGALSLAWEGGRTGRAWDWWGGPRTPVVLFGVTWLCVALAPRFVMRIPEHLNEHQMYLPMVGISLMIAAVVGPRDRPRSAA